jgi:hypothetical protein
VSKKDEPKVIIHNHINNSNNNNQQLVENSDQGKDSSNSILNRIALWMTIIAGLIAVYYFFRDEIGDILMIDYDPKVEDVIGG